MRTGKATGCKPTYREVANGPLQAAAGSWTFKTRVLLIGTEKNMQLIGAKDMAKIAEVLNAVLHEKGLDLQFHPQAYREYAVAKINTALGKPLVDDVFFCGFSSAESM